MRIFAYYNVQKQTFSLKALEGPHKGRVIAHRKRVVLSDCEFAVSEAGRQRVLRERKKNVHAGVKGTWRQVLPEGLSCPVRLSYNPYKGKTFITVDTGTPVFNAKLVELRDHQAFVPKPD